MQKAYARIEWENYPSEETPVNETNLNKMDGALDEVDNRVITLSVEKLDKETAYDMVKGVIFDESTGIFTITRLNGSTYKIDTKLEKLAINFNYNHKTEKLEITLEDGTIQYVDLASLITVYEFMESDEIYFQVDTSGKVTAHIKDGSIKAEKLQPNFLADVMVQAEIATQKASEAATQASVSKTEADRATTEADRAAQYSGIVAPGFYVDIETMTLYQKAGVGVDFIVAEDNVLCWKIA